MRKNVSLTSIARACGVSAMTVSRVFRHDSGVGPATRRRILAAAAQKGYHPGTQTGRPSAPKQNNRAVAQVIVDTNLGGANLFHAYLLGVIEGALARHKYDCLLRTYNGSYDNFIWLCDLLRSEEHPATIILGNFSLKHMGTMLKLCPKVLLVDYTDNPRLALPYNSIGFDNVEAARLAIRHLFDIGRRRILLLKGHAEHIFSIEIERGYREMHLINGLKINESLITTSDFTSGGAERTVSGLLRRGFNFDAVFTNDEMALGVMAALRTHGKSIPRDIAVCGCDGLPFGKYLQPALTTVVLDYAELGEMAVEQLVMSNSRTSQPVRIRLLPKLEIRESTKKRK